MLGAKYKDSFVEKHIDYTSIIDAIEEKENEFKKNILEWNGYNLSQYLKSFHSVSPSSLNKYMVGLKKFISFVAEKEGVQIDRKFSINNEKFINCIDVSKLLETTISDFQYQKIKNQLIMPDHVNVRDKLLFELAWQGLTHDEIKFLKVENIEVGDDNAIISLGNNIILIEHAEVVEDIKAVIAEQYYRLTSCKGIEKTMSYMDSEYLFKPIMVGKNIGKEETFLSNPNTALKNSLFRNGVECEGINMRRLSLEDIRRSKIIYLIHHAKEMNLEEISVMFDVNDSNLNWLREIAKVKYTAN